MVKRYLKFLDDIAEKVTKKGVISNFIKKYKWRLIIFIFLIKTVEVMYTIYQRGYCLNCDTPTEKELNELGTSIDKWQEYNQQFTFVTYPSLKTYLIDLIIPLSITWISLIIMVSLFYLIYKITTISFNILKDKIREKFKLKFQEQIKNIEKINK